MELVSQYSLQTLTPLLPRMAEREGKRFLTVLTPVSMFHAVTPFHLYKSN